MIEAITGVNGTGKTCYSMQRLLDAFKAGRPIFQHGIPGLQIESEQIYCRSPLCEVCRSATITDQDVYAEDWHLWAPDKAYIVLDEVQRVFRSRSAGAKLPESLIALETHRHKGLDFLLLTQQPSFIDINLRKLIGKHIHLSSTWFGRFQYETDEVSDNPKSLPRKRYRLNRSHFKLYKSASHHTKLSRSVPWQIWAVIPVLLFMLYSSYNAYSRFFAEKPVETSSNDLPLIQNDYLTPGETGAPRRFDPVADNPFQGWSPRISGTSRIAGKQSVWFEWSREGYQPISYKSGDLFDMGISVEVHNSCRVTLSQGDWSEVVRCGRPRLLVESEETRPDNSSDQVVAESFYR